jgi:hypothetical protein
MCLSAPFRFSLSPRNRVLWLLYLLAISPKIDLRYAAERGVTQRA